MREAFRTCPECGGERLFQLHHAEPGSCPDSPDGDCPEWSCTQCGAALLAGFVLHRADASLMSHSVGRVA